MAEVTVFTPAGMEPDRGAVEQIERCITDERAVRGALMADHHRGYSMPIGGVIAYADAVSPSGVGFDIACGNKCVRTNLRTDDVAPAREGLLREVRKRIAFGLGRVNPEPIEHELFTSPVWEDLEQLSPGLKEKAQRQLGTVGSGNHYVDLLAGDDGQLWVANHFGSRGLGHTICTGFLNIAKGEPFGARLRESETPTVLDLNTEVGETYFAAMELAGEYAYAGRDYVIDQVLAVLGAEPTLAVHNHHNYAWREGDEIVVRKGATPLTREPAFIGGSMGDSSVIVRGTGDEIGNIASAPHGAGRVMSRTKAAGKFVKVKRNGRRVRMRDPRTGAIDWRQVQDELRARGIVVLGGGADEAPAVYKPLRDVLAAHPNVEILHTLDPIGVVMAGADEFDPYKD